MRKINTICVVGLGLIGGSIALAVKEKTDYTLLGIDREEAVCRAALAAGAADRVGGAELLEQADLVILALPPDAAVSFLREEAGRIPAGAAVTDVCGVKRQVVSACEEICGQHGLHFLGGHPMAGKEVSGFANADSHLFEGASYILTPTERTAPELTAFLMTFAAEIGCRTAAVTSPEHHDEMIAYTSQLPHVLAGAYVKSPAAKGHSGYSAGSFRDVSRVATVDERLWSGLFLQNGDNLCRELDGLIDRLTAYKTAIASGNEAALRALIREGREIKSALPR